MPRAGARLVVFCAGVLAVIEGLIALLVAATGSPFDVGQQLQLGGILVAVGLAAALSVRTRTVNRTYSGNRPADSNTRLSSTDRERDGKPQTPR